MQLAVPVEEYAVGSKTCEVCDQMMALSMESAERVGICPECQRDIPE